MTLTERTVLPPFALRLCSGRCWLWSNTALGCLVLRSSSSKIAQCAVYGMPRHRRSVFSLRRLREIAGLTLNLACFQKLRTSGLTTELALEAIFQ